MTWEIGLLLGIIFACLVLFTFEWVPTDVTAIGLVVTLILTGLLTTDQAFAGFGSDTVIMILGLLIMTAGLLRTGVMELAGTQILRFTGNEPMKLLIGIMVASAGLSAFISNTAATAFFVPMVIGLANRAKINPSKLLMPLAFASILSSSVTLISTSTNIVVSGVMTQSGMEPMGMFELAPVGIPIAVVGLVYMLFIGRKLIPDRAHADDLMTEFGVRPYMSEIIISPKSPLIGKTLGEAALGRDYDLTVVGVLRANERNVLPRRELALKEGDVLLVHASSESLLKVKDTAGIDIKADVKHADPTVQTDSVRLVEVIVPPKSPLIGRTLRGQKFRERQGVQVLGLNRHGENIKSKLSELPLRMGDVLLIQGPVANINTLQDDNTLRVLGTVGENRPVRRRARRAILVFAAALALGTFKIVSFPVAVLLGSLGMFVSRCVTPEEAYREVEWKVVILIACMLALGAAMESTGTASYLAGMIVHLARDAGPVALLTGFFALTVLLTQPMSNQAAAVVILPIAIETARQLGLNERTFVMMVALAASCSYLTPLEPSCLMVYGPGRYKFMDFLKVGSLLTLLIYGLAIYLVPKVWPLEKKEAPQAALSSAPPLAGSPALAW